MTKAKKCNQVYLCLQFSPAFQIDFPGKDVLFALKSNIPTSTCVLMQPSEIHPVLIQLWKPAWRQRKCKHLYIRLHWQRDGQLFNCRNLRAFWAAFQKKSLSHHQQRLPSTSLANSLRNPAQQTTNAWRINMHCLTFPEGLYMMNWQTQERLF